jgi:uroporphyrinogen-III synthase
MSKPLNGVRVAVTEHRYTAQLAQLLERQGATVLACPLVAETPIEDSEGAKRFIELCQTTTVDIIVFFTGVGVDLLFRAVNKPEIISRSTILARGPKAVSALRRAGIRIDLVADSPTTEGIIQTLSRQDLHEKSVLVQLYGEEKGELAAALEARGARVTGISLYRYTAASDTQAVANLLSEIVQGKIDAITFTSAPQIRFLFDAARAGQMEAELRHRLQNDVVVASIGHVTARGLTEAGIEAHVISGDTKMGPMVMALAEHFQKRNKCSTPSS